MKKIILVLSFAALGAACGEKVPPPAEAPVPKAQAEELPAGSMLKAPGNYVRNTVGQIDKAKAATALYEKAAKARVNNPDLGGTTGD